MNDSKRLALYRIASKMETYTIDNGPMGESRPFSEYAAELRRIADDGESDTDSVGNRRRFEANGLVDDGPNHCKSHGTGDFRDIPWEPR